MDFDTYQHLADKTAIYPGKGTVDGLVYSVLGLTGEAGEVANKVKKILRDANGVLTPKVRTAIIDELGDAQWYIAEVATELGVSLAEVAERNLRKLTARAEAGTLPGGGDKR